MSDETPSGDLGGLVIPTPKAEGGGSAASNLLDAARGGEGDTPKRKYTKRNTGLGTGNNASPVLPLSPELYAKLYSPRLWGRVLTAPADAAGLITGSKTWEVSENEKEMLGDTGAVAAQCFATHDPRYLALALVVIALVDVYAIRFAMYRAEVKAKEKANAA